MATTLFRSLVLLALLALPAPLAAAEINQRQHMGPRQRVLMNEQITRGMVAGDSDLVEILQSEDLAVDGCGNLNIASFTGTDDVPEQVVVSIDNLIVNCGM